MTVIVCFFSHYSYFYYLTWKVFSLRYVESASKPVIFVPLMATIMSPPIVTYFPAINTFFVPPLNPALAAGPPLTT